jgi:hypothetical protein
MLVQEQSVHSLDLTDLDLEKENEEEERKKKKEKEEEEEEEEKEIEKIDKENQPIPTIVISEFDEYLDLLEIF